VPTPRDPSSIREASSVIVVGYDGSESAAAALDAAVELARGSGEPVAVVTVWKELHGDFGLPVDRLLHGGLQKVEREWAEETAGEAAARAARAGVAAEVEIRHGDAAAGICAVAAERGARLVVVGTHGSGSLEAAVLGSVSRAVVRRARCSVLVARAAEVRV
jgi:nucleotide-binding universal stress UspA family protein